MSAEVRPPWASELPELDALAAEQGWPVLALELDSPTTLACVVTEGGCVWGFAVGVLAADEGELHFLGVAGDARRRGLGARVLAGFEAEAWGRGAARLFLEVRADNVAARHLYARAGWRVAGLRRAYYRDGMDAVVLEKGRPHPPTEP